MQNDVNTYIIYRIHNEGIDVLDIDSPKLNRYSEENPIWVEHVTQL